MIHKIAFLIAIVSGLLLGSYFVQRFGPRSQSPYEEVYAQVERQTKFDLSDVGTEDRLRLGGWQRGDFSGFWMTGSSASLEIPIESVSPDGDFLRLGGLLKLKGSEPDATVPVASLRARIGQIQLGVWTIWGDQSFPTHRFAIPGTVRDSDRPLILTFEQIEEGAPRPWRVALGLKRLEFENKSAFKSFRSHLDSCQGSTISGWSMAEDLPIPVDVMIDGVIQPSTLVQIYRPDLKAAGIPPTAGFQLTLDTPPPAGTEVSVVYRGFPDKQIVRSPCKF